VGRRPIAECLAHGQRPAHRSLGIQLKDFSTTFKGQPETRAHGLQQLYRSIDHTVGETLGQIEWLAGSQIQHHRRITAAKSRNHQPTTSPVSTTVHFNQLTI
jgi:hypothetical protein